MCESLAFDCDEGHFLEWHLLVCLWVQHDSVSIWFCFRTSRKLFNPNEAWQQAVFWILQKHSYKNKVACHSLCRTSRDYQGLCGVVIFFWTHSLSFWGKRDMFVYPICFLVARSVSIFAYMILECPLGVPQLFRNEPKIFPLFPHSVHVLELCQWVAHTLVSAERKVMLCIYWAVPLRASSEVRFSVSVARPNWGLSWAAGWSNTSTSDYPASCLKIGIDHLTRCVWISRYLFNSEHKDVCSHSAVPAQLCCSCTRQGTVTRHVTVQGRCW